MKNKKAFTLVELLAVIVILAVILVIAVPQVLDVIDTTKVGSLESSAKLIANSAEKKYAEYLALGKDTSTIQCSDVTKLNDKDYGTCTISFDDKGEATVSIKGKENGKFEGLKCEGTKDNMVCEDIPPLPVLNCTFTPSEEDLVETKVYTVKDYDACMTYLKSTIPEEELTDEILNQADSICKGNGIPEDGKSTSVIFEGMISGSTELEQELIDLNVINVEISSDLKTGTKYAHGQYTYTYNVAFYGQYNYSTYIDGWSVKLTDKDSTDQVTSEVCTYINNKPIVSMSGMFERSNATIVDLSSFNTSNVTDMRNMFSWSAITSLDLSNFNTSKETNMSSMFSSSEVINLDLSSFNTGNVTDMRGMFLGTKATVLDLSNFDTSNVIDMGVMFQSSAATSINLSSFDTSNVETMYSMFAYSAATSLDLSSFDTSNVTDMIEMFKGSAAKKLDLSSFDTSHVIYMWSMFQNSAATSLDLSSFDTSNVTDMSYMFQNSSATTGYARTQVDADKFNSSSNKPSTLTFVVKGS